MKEIHCTTKGCGVTKQVNRFGPKSFLCNKCKAAVDEPILQDSPDIKFKYINCFVCGTKIQTTLYGSNEQICTKQSCADKAIIIYQDKIANEIKTIADLDHQSLTMKEYIYVQCLANSYGLSNRHYLYKLLGQWMITPSFVGDILTGITVTDQSKQLSHYVTSSNIGVKTPKQVIEECRYILKLRETWLKSHKA